MSLSGGLKLVLIGDGESPHLLKWARALKPRVQLHAISSRGFLPEFLQLLPDAQRLALNTAPRAPQSCSWTSCGKGGPSSCSTTWL